MKQTTFLFHANFDSWKTLLACTPFPSESVHYTPGANGSARQRCRGGERSLVGGNGAVKPALNPINSSERKHGRIEEIREGDTEKASIS